MNKKLATKLAMAAIIISMMGLLLYKGSVVGALIALIALGMVLA